MPTRSSTTNRVTTNGTRRTNTNKDKAMATKTDTNTQVNDNLTDLFPSLDEEPVFAGPPGRAKSALRLRLEGMSIGERIVAGDLGAIDAGEGTDEEKAKAKKNLLASVRGMTGEITKKLGQRYSTRPDVNGRIVVTRVVDKSATDKD